MSAVLFKPVAKVCEPSLIALIASLLRKLSDKYAAKFKRTLQVS